MEGVPDEQNFPGDKDERKGDLPDLDGERPDFGNIEERDDINRNEISGGIGLSGTYETVQDYIDALNAETDWVTYDSEANTATITILQISSAH